MDLPNKEVSITTGHLCVCNVDHVLIRNRSERYKLFPAVKTNTLWGGERWQVCYCLHMCTHFVDEKVDLRGRLEFSVQCRDATGPHQVLHLVLEHEQLNAELLLGHVQKTSQLCHGHGGIELQETAGNKQKQTM